MRLCSQLFCIYDNRNPALWTEDSVVNIQIVYKVRRTVKKLRLLDIFFCKTKAFLYHFQLFLLYFSGLHNKYNKCSRRNRGRSQKGGEMFDQDMKTALSELWGWIIVDFLLVAYSMLNNSARGRLNTVSIILCFISAVFSLCCILDVKLLEETALYNGTVGKVMESCTFLAIFLSAASLFY